MMLTVLTAALFLGVIYVAWITADRGDRARGLEERPAWLGPDPVATAAAARTRLLGETNVTSDRGLDELAAHHAHEMAVLGFDGELDPEGRGLESRRERLQPAWVGEMCQLQRRVELPDGATPDRLAAALVSDELKRELGPLANRSVAVAVGTHHKNAAICVLIGEPWGTLRGRLKEHPDGGFALRLELAPGVRKEELTARIRAAGDAWSEPTPGQQDKHEGRCWFHLPAVEPVGPMDYQILRGGRPGRVRSWGS